MQIDSHGIWRKTHLWTNIYTPMSFAVANIFQWKTPVTWPKNWHWFFRLLRFICHFSINIKIEVHFFCLHWEMKGHWSRENFWEALRASQHLHMTSVLSFPNANKESVLQSLTDDQCISKAQRPTFGIQIKQGHEAFEGLYQLNIHAK